jgi:putative nucleotidyltransferase with HDIG domain
VSHIRLFDESLDMAVEMAKRIDVILMLDEINKAISSSLSHARIIETAMASIERIIQCELVTVLGEEKGQLVVTASRSAGIAIPEFLHPGALLTGHCIVCDAFSKGKSNYIPHLGTGKRLHPLDRALAQAGLESLLAIPLISKEMTKGVLLLGSTEAGQLGRESAFTIEKIASQMAVALENARLYEEMRNLFISTVTSLANAIDAKSPWTKGHSERVMHIAANIAKEMGLDEAMIERVRLGGLLHDIGKIGIIEALLEKPEMLSEDEFPPMRLHPEKGVAILAPIEQLRDVLPGILHHHERYDGTGYPKRLKGKAIPLAARIITVADSFDAMVADRPYKKGFSVTQALAELRKCARSQFDPDVVEHFCDYAERIMPRKNQNKTGKKLSQR